jgi:hypothetical protein
MVTANKERTDRLAEITACCGKRAAIYAGNKARGGHSNKKGSRYEDFFAAHKVAEIIVSCLGNGGVWPILREQVLAFVDDLVVSTASANDYHQLKNTESLSWTSKPHSIADDFELQFKLSTHLGEQGPTTSLVVSSEALANELAGTMPVGIKAHSNVKFFPYMVLRRLATEFPELKENLSLLTRVANPQGDELANAYGALIVGLMQHDGGSVLGVLEAAQSTSPALLRLMPSQMSSVKLDANFLNVLAQIPHLKYCAERGFFEWSAYGTSGVLEFNCLDEKFTRFEARVVKKNPKCFDDFEELLP